MTCNNFLTIIFYLIISFRITNADEQCVFAEAEDGYFGMFIESHGFKNFVGFCDMDTLIQWQPCPFKTKRDICYPGPDKIQRNQCDMHNMAIQRHCNCSSSLRYRQLQPVPDFPTCFLGRRRSLRTASVINNCIRCMTKHPDAGIVRLGPLANFRCCRKPSKSLDHHRSRGTGSCSLIRKYRSYVPADVKNKLVQRLKRPNSEQRMEMSSNFALDRIIRAVSKDRKLIKRQTQGKDEDIEDDDEDDDDNIGEDIAIEEDENTEMEATTTEIGEKPELRQQQHQEEQNYNFTGEIDEENVTKKHNDSRKNGCRCSQAVPTSYWCTTIVLLLTISQ